MKKPKLFDEAMHIRLPAGTKMRVEKLRGKMRQADFIRMILLEALNRSEEDSKSSDSQIE